jgi:hypothetical protein
MCPVAGFGTGSTEVSDFNTVLVKKRNNIIYPTLKESFIYLFLNSPGVAELFIFPSDSQSLHASTVYIPPPSLVFRLCYSQFLWIPSFHK